MAATSNTIAVSDIHKSFPTVIQRLSESPLLVLKGSMPVAWLVSTNEWDRLDKMQRHVSDLEAIVGMLNLEIDRLKKGLPESIPVNISKMEQVAQRVSA